MTINAWKYSNTFRISTYLLWSDYMFGVKMYSISHFEKSWPIAPLCNALTPGKAPQMLCKLWSKVALQVICSPVFLRPFTVLRNDLVVAVCSLAVF